MIFTGIVGIACLYGVDRGLKVKLEGKRKEELARRGRKTVSNLNVADLDEFMSSLTDEQMDHLVDGAECS